MEHREIARSSVCRGEFGRLSVCRGDSGRRQRRARKNLIPGSAARARVRSRRRNRRRCPMSTSRDYPAEPPRLPRVVLLRRHVRGGARPGGPPPPARVRARLPHRRTPLTHEFAGRRPAAAREAARLRSLSSVEASLGPAADALRLRNWTLDLLNVGERRPQTRPRERREAARGARRRGGAARQRAALRGGARPFAWFPSPRTPSTSSALRLALRRRRPRRCLRRRPV